MQELLRFPATEPERASALYDTTRLFPIRSGRIRLFPVNFVLPITVSVFKSLMLASVC